MKNILNFIKSFLKRVKHALGLVVAHRRVNPNPYPVRVSELDKNLISLVEEAFLQKLQKAYSISMSELESELENL